MNVVGRPMAAGEIDDVYLSFTPIYAFRPTPLGSAPAGQILGHGGADGLDVGTWHPPTPARP
jgi:hypothetical protein